MLVVLMALGSLVLCLGLPVGWLLLTRPLRSDAARYLIVLVGCPITMVVTGGLLLRLDAVYAQARGISKQRPRTTLLEIFVMAAAAIALVALVAWWFIFADSPSPSGPIQPV